MVTMKTNHKNGRQLHFNNVYFSNTPGDPHLLFHQTFYNHDLNISDNLKKSKDNFFLQYISTLRKIFLVQLY